MNIYLPEDDDKLLDECEVTTFRASGAGGQHVNVTDSAVRLTHLPSKIVVMSQTERSQFLNKKTCLLKLREKVKKLNYKKPRRIKTKVPYSVVKKNASKKTKDSKKKQLRNKPLPD